MNDNNAPNGSVFRHRALTFLTGWHGIGLVNAWVIFVAVNIIAKMIPMLLNTADNVKELEDMVDALATIFVAYGVALEERASLMNIFGLYPSQACPRQEYTDRICHAYGLSLLLLGLFMELAVQLIKVPDRVINTQGMEWFIFSIAFFFILASSYMICRLSWLLFRPRLSAAVHPAEAALYQG